MTSTLSKEAILPTPGGEVRIRSFCNPQEIKQYTFNSDFGISDDYKSLFTRRESLAKRAAREGVNALKKKSFISLDIRGPGRLINLFGPVTRSRQPVTRGWID